MEYNYDEMFKEVLNRRNELEAKREKSIDVMLKVASAVMTVAIVVALCLQPDMTTVENHSVSGALMLSSTSGVFVLVAVLAFLLGITVTLMSVRKKKHDDDSDAANQDV